MHIARDPALLVEKGIPHAWVKETAKPKVVSDQQNTLFFCSVAKLNISGIILSSGLFLYRHLYNRKLNIQWLV